MDERAFLDLATKRLKREIDADEHNRQAAVEDLKFLNGDQWDPAEEQRRTPTWQAVPEDERTAEVRQPGRGRHAPQQGAHQGEARRFRGGREHRASIRSGVIANIEYLSNAEAIYDYAGEMATSCG